MVACVREDGMIFQFSEADRPTSLGQESDGFELRTVCR